MPSHPEWIAKLTEWNVAKAYFAHDLLVWERDASDLGKPVLA